MTDKKKKEANVSEKMPEKQIVYVMAFNVKHDGTLYKKGSVVPDAMLDLFEEKGFVEVI